MENKKPKSKVFTIIIGLIIGSIFGFYIYKNIIYPLTHPSIARKPIIYLYPTKETNISLELGKTENLTHTYPKYNTAWEVTAYPNGDLTDTLTGKKYYALYWEGIFTSKIKDTGFIVKGSETIPFLEEKLKILGLNDREANEFIIYWLPELENNPYNYIHFQDIEEINDNMPLNISPKPDSIIRIMMEYKPLTKPYSIKEQQLTTPERSGFTVVEWGGTQIKK